jgi:hypothetical protein
VFNEECAKLAVTDPDRQLVTIVANVALGNDPENTQFTSWNVERTSSIRISFPGVLPLKMQLVRLIPRHLADRTAVDTVLL